MEGRERGREEEREGGGGEGEKERELGCVYVCMCAGASVTIATAYGKYTADLMQCITTATVQTDALTSSPEHHTASSCAGSHASSAERNFIVVSH